MFILEALESLGFLACAFIPWFVDLFHFQSQQWLVEPLTWLHSDAGFCFPLSLTRTLVITLCLLDNPEKSLSLKIFNIITSAKSQSKHLGVGCYYSIYLNSAPSASKIYFSA